MSLSGRGTAEKLLLHAGPIHFLHFSTEEPYNPGSAQYQ